MKVERASASIQSDRWSYLWLAIATLLGFFWVIPLTTWLSPIFMLRFMRTQKVWRGFILVWLSTFVTLGITLRNMLPLPSPMYLPTIAFSALTVGALPFLADRLLAHRLKGFAATLVFPLAALIARGQEIARQEGIYLAMPIGTEYQDGRPFENKLIVVDPAGQIALEHYKYGGAAIEGFKPGDGVLRTVETPFGTLSGIICWDTDAAG